MLDYIGVGEFLDAEGFVVHLTRSRDFRINTKRLTIMISNTAFNNRICKWRSVW